MGGSSHLVQCAGDGCDVKVLSFVANPNVQLFCPACWKKRQDAEAEAAATKDRELAVWVKANLEEALTPIVPEIGVPVLYASMGFGNFRGRWPEEVPGAIVGKTGVGKTHLAIGYLKRHVLRRAASLLAAAETGSQAQAILRGNAASAYFVSCVDIVWQTRAMMNGNSKELHAMIEDICSREFVVIDDLGAERQTDWSVELMTKLIYTRHAHARQTLVTMNSPISEIAQVFGDRTASRIHDFGRVQNVGGKDGRLAS